MLIYSRVNCCTARGLAVGVGAEPRRPSGRPAGRIVRRLSWSLHLPGAGFKMHARTCLVEGRKKERKVGFRCPLAPLRALWGPWLQAGAELDPSVPGQRNVGSAPVPGSYQGLEPGASPTRTGCFSLICFT